MFSFLNTFKRLLGVQENSNKIQREYSEEQLIQWATGCMMEGLPDTFHQARLLCIRNPNPENSNRWIVSVNHDVMLTADSEYKRFQPADDLYPTQCLEMILEGKDWHEATITFNPENASFNWQ